VKDARSEASATESERSDAGGATGGAPEAPRGATGAAAVSGPRHRSLLRGQRRSSLGDRTRDLDEGRGTLELEPSEDQGLRVRYEDTSGAHGAGDWTLTLFAAEGQALAPGVYLPAWSSRGPGEPELRVGAGELCGRGGREESGWFQIHELERNADDGRVTRFAADFEHRCTAEASNVSLGQVRYESDHPIDEAWVNATLWLRELQRGREATGALLRLGRPTVHIAIAESTPGRVAFLVPEQGRAPWRLGFATGRGEPLVLGRYERATSPEVGKIDRPVLEVGRDAAGCGEIRGWFDILDVKFTADGSLERFAAGFGQACENNGSNLRGQLHWDSDVDLDQDLVLP
jgi:hypothetical protein